MSQLAYYNENDTKAAAWLRQLIADGLIMDGVVDERSIAEVRPEDVSGFRRCHFFAGIAGWDYALQLAKWPADREVWTGSCPCQPFSAAGKRKGVDDERHLWPEFARLIAARKPATVFGEQVASKDGREWLAGVFADLEGMGYQRAGADLCAAGVGAPHIRQRLFWVADASNHGSLADRCEPCRTKEKGRMLESQGRSCWIPNSNGCIASDRDLQRGRELGLQPKVRGDVRGLGNSASHNERRSSIAAMHGQGQSTGRSSRNCWSDFDHIPCGDGKTRRLKPCIKPLVDGIPRGLVPGCDISESHALNTAEARVMRLRGYGNAINPELTAEFIAAYMEAQ